LFVYFKGNTTEYKIFGNITYSLFTDNSQRIRLAKCAEVFYQNSNYIYLGSGLVQTESFDKMPPGNTSQS
jgi:hypothetical protein